MNRVLQQILQGIWHWTAPNPSIGGTQVSSYWLETSDGLVMIDPLLPEHFDQVVAKRGSAPSAVVLANRHHYRDSGEIQKQYACEVYVPAAGLHEFGKDRPVTGYAPGDELPGGLIAVEVGALSADDGGLYLESARALWLADTVLRAPTDPDAEIGWVPDSLMDDPAATKHGLLAAYQRLLDTYVFDHLLLAHGLPLIGNGREELERLLQDGGRTAPNAF